MEHSKTTQTIPDYWERFQLRAILTVSLGYLAPLVPLRAIRASRETRRESSTVTLGGLPLLYTSGAGLSSKIDTPDQSIFRYWAFSMGYKMEPSGPPSVSTPQGRKTLHTLMYKGIQRPNQDVNFQPLVNKGNQPKMDESLGYSTKTSVNVLQSDSYRDAPQDAPGPSTAPNPGVTYPKNEDTLPVPEIPPVKGHPRTHPNPHSDSKGT